MTLPSEDADDAVLPSLVPLTVSRLVGVLAPEQQVDPPSESRLLDDLAYHSLALAELAFAIEEIFALDAIDPAQVMQIETVGDIIELVLKALDQGDGRLPSRHDLADALADYGATASLPDRYDLAG